MSAVYDISCPLNERTLAYPGDPAFRMQRLKTIGADSNYALSHYAMGSHCGTHMDAPAHFIAGGRTLDAFPPERWVTPALVQAVPGDTVTKDDIPEKALSPGMSILFKTRNSAFLRQGIFPGHPCEITPAAAEKIASLKLGLVGIDWLTVEPGAGGEFPVHAVLLSNEIFILESILLDTVPEGRYTLHAAPLAVTGADGAPVRALLLPPV